MKEEEFFALSEGDQRARLGLDSRDKLITPSTPEVAKAAEALKAKQAEDAKAKAAAAAAPKPAA